MTFILKTAIRSLIQYFPPVLLQSDIVITSVGVGTPDGGLPVPVVVVPGEIVVAVPGIVELESGIPPPCEFPIAEVGKGRSVDVWFDAGWAMAVRFLFFPPTPPPTAAAMITTRATTAIIMIPFLVR
jgi:hypothetical protein